MDHKGADMSDKPSKAEKLARAMDSVVSGGRSFNRQLAAQIRDELRRMDRRAPSPAVPDDMAGLIAELRDGVPRVPEDRREYIGEPDWDAADRQMERAADALEAQAELVGKLRGGRLAMLGHETHQAADTIEAQAAELARKDAENARLRDALEPFAKAARIRMCGEWRDDERIWRTDAVMGLTFGHIRAADAALTHPTGEPT